MTLNGKKNSSELLEDVLAKKPMTYTYVYSPAIPVATDTTSIVCSYSAVHSDHENLTKSISPYCSWEN